MHHIRIGTEPMPDSTLKFNSPWRSTGCFIKNHPLVLCLGLFFFFWLYRSQVYSGDGDQLERMVEAGIWMVQTELLSHAIFQIVYKILKHFTWDTFSVLNLVSCLAGVGSIWIVLKFNSNYVKLNPLWSLGLFLSSGLSLLCTGHTEYYTLFLVTMLYYGYVSVGYLKGRFSSLHVSLAFSLALWMHLGILFALPSLLVLPLLKRQVKDYSGIGSGLSLSVAAYFFKHFNLLFGIHIQGLSPVNNFAPIFFDPQSACFYSQFQWGHLIDLLHAWSIRSWIFWPFLLWAIRQGGLKKLFTADRLFLLIYTLGFTFFVLTWHPNLGIHQDWDLFALEAAPCLLLLLLFLSDFLHTPFHRTALAISVIASIGIMYSTMLTEANFDQRGFGSVEIDTSMDVPCIVTFQGHAKSLHIPILRLGTYMTKIINTEHFRTHDFYTAVAPNAQTRYPLEVGPDQGRGRDI